LHSFARGNINSRSKIGDSSQKCKAAQKNPKIDVLQLPINVGGSSKLKNYLCQPINHFLGMQILPFLHEVKYLL
jgi:hypothetical protein